MKAEAGHEISRNVNERIGQIYGKGVRYYVAQGEDEPFFEGILSIIERIFNGKLRPGMADQDLADKQYQELVDAVGEGFGVNIAEVDMDSPDNEMLKELDDNVFVFSAFKNYHELKEMSEQLKDAEGNLRSFENFKNQALKIHDKYNLNYLRSEYEHAVSSSQMASKWQDIQRDKEALPVLRYETAGDDRVRQEHEEIDGVTLPVDDAFWDSNLPPNGWRCRCDVTQMTNRAQTTDKRTIGEVEKDPMFTFNPGKEKVVFPQNHPYYDVQKEHEGRAKENFGLKKPDKK